AIQRALHSPDIEKLIKMGADLSVIQSTIKKEIKKAHWRTEQHRSDPALGRKLGSTPTPKESGAEANKKLSYLRECKHGVKGTLTESAESLCTDCTPTKIEIIRRERRRKRWAKLEAKTPKESLDKQKARKEKQEAKKRRKS